MFLGKLWGVSRTIAENPSIELRGVRNSWLMWARKELLALLARSAASLAISSSRVLSAT
jgi:hypothetical protein